MTKRMCPFNCRLFVVIGILFSCCVQEHNAKFESERWQDYEDAVFPPKARAAMLNDLVSNQKLVGSDYNDIIELLGIPDDKDSTSLAYKVSVRYGFEIDPIYIKELVLHFGTDSTINRYTIEEWSKADD